MKIHKPSLKSFKSLPWRNKRFYIPLALGIALLVAVGAAGYFLVLKDSKKNPADVTNQVKAYYQSGDCAKALKEFGNVNMADYQEQSQKEILKLRSECQLKEGNYAASLGDAESLRSLLDRTNAGPAEKRENENLIETIKLVKETDAKDRAREKKIEEKLKDGKSKPYEGPLL